MWITDFTGITVKDEMIHKILWNYFPEASAAKVPRPFCYYKISQKKLLMYSSIQPKASWSRVESFQEDVVYTFELDASYRKRAAYRDENGVRRHHRVKQPSEPAELKEWLQRRLGKSATLGYVDCRRAGTHRLEHVAFPKTEFKGTLTVHDVDEFERIISRGIGAGGAYGLGLMRLS